MKHCAMILFKNNKFLSLAQLFFFISILGSLPVILFLNVAKSQMSQILADRGLEKYQLKSDVEHKKQNPKSILLWNKFFLSDDYGLGFGTGPLEGFNCPRICSLTSDREQQSTADAVVIHSFYLPKDVPNATLPLRRSQNQIFVFFILENPFRSHKGFALLNHRDVFNLTMTYLDDTETDIIMPYGGIVKKKTEKNSVPVLEILLMKKKQVVWLVSNCNAPSSRYEYARVLSTHIEVDILGKCGNDICPKGINCIDILEHDYRFYLAFENGFCKDYITEKAFKLLEATMVPIVYGGANYSHYMPPKSYIDVRDFDSPAHLAAYLNYLGNNITAYREYFSWKEDYIVKNSTWFKYDGFCKLCQILYDDDYSYKSHFDPLEYWDQDMCLTGGDEREAVHLG